MVGTGATEAVATEAGAGDVAVVPVSTGTGARAAAVVPVVDGSIPQCSCLS